MATLYCGQDHEHRALAGIEACGCVAAVAVLTHEEVEAYKDAARWAKAGLRVEEMAVTAVRQMAWTCPDHTPGGPPWWRSNGGTGKRPKAVSVGLGL